MQTHNLFEEIPSLGMAQDMVMPLASPEAEPKLDFRVGRPAYTELTRSFHEYVAGTCLSLKYLRSLSDII
jgi:hypothetical protein